MPDLGPDADADLMIQVRHGDDEAFRILMAKYKVPIMNFAYRYIGDSHEAEDMAQEVFVRVYLAAPRYRPTAKFTTWLYRIATHVCLDAKAKHRPLPESALASDERPAPLSNTPDSRPSPAVMAERAELTAVIHAALGHLQPRERMAVIWSRYEGASLDEMADRLGASVGAVKSLLQRAKEKLRILLAPRLRP